MHLTCSQKYILLIYFQILTNDDSFPPNTVVELKSDVSQNLKESSSGKDPTLLVPPDGELLQVNNFRCLYIY